MICIVNILNKCKAATLAVAVAPGSGITTAYAKMKADPSDKGAKGHGDSVILYGCSLG
jgi:hypothetical protein